MIWYSSGVHNVKKRGSWIDVQITSCVYRVVHIIIPWSKVDISRRSTFVHETFWIILGWWKMSLKNEHLYTKDRSFCIDLIVIIMIFPITTNRNLYWNQHWTVIEIMVRNRQKNLVLWLFIIVCYSQYQHQRQSSSHISITPFVKATKLDTAKKALELFRLPIFLTQAWICEYKGTAEQYEGERTFFIKGSNKFTKTSIGNFAVPLDPRILTFWHNL